MCRLIVVINSNNGRVPIADPRPSLGMHARELHLQRGLSQENLAEFLDPHRNYVGEVERGERNIARLNIVALADALCVKPAELFETLS